MSRLTPEQKYYRTKRTLLLVSVGALVIIVLVLLQKCNEGKSAQLAYDAIDQRLNNVVDDSARIKGLLDEERKKTNDLELTIAEMTSNLVLTSNALVDASEKNKQLGVAYKKARAQRDTVTSFILCDSLVSENENISALLTSANSQVTAINELRKEEKRGLQNQINILQSAYDSCLSAVVFTKKELPAIKPKGKLCAVVSGIGSGPLLGIGGGFTLVTKNHVLIGAKAYATNQGLLTTVEFGVPLNFKRK